MNRLGVVLNNVGIQVSSDSDPQNVWDQKISSKRGSLVEHNNSCQDHKPQKNDIDEGDLDHFLPEEDRSPYQIEDELNSEK